MTRSSAAAGQNAAAPRRARRSRGRTPARPAQGGSAAPRPITAGDNAVYRLDADGVPVKSFASKPSSMRSPGSTTG